MVLPEIIEMYTQTVDRAIRLQLLAHLPLYEKHLSSQPFEKLHLELLYGTECVSRCPSYAHSLPNNVLSDRLNDKNLNNELVRSLARIQRSDPNDCVRTNTTILLSILARRLDPQNRPELMFGAFSRPFHEDPFIPARLAALSAFQDNLALFPVEYRAKRIVPCVSSLLIDANIELREKAFSLVKSIIDELESLSKGRRSLEQLESEVTKCDKGQMGHKSNSGVWSDYLSVFSRLVPQSRTPSDVVKETEKVEVFKSKPIEENLKRENSKDFVVVTDVTLQQSEKKSKESLMPKRRPMKLKAQRVKESDSLF
ncbi:hypothetical protein ACOME3_000474 [Neoechinorhynchus agilis]